MLWLFRGSLLVFALTHLGSRLLADPLPRYDHILVIILENHGYEQIIGNPKAPNLNRLASRYGSATRFYGEVHPSEANYVAMIGGDTFGIHDDDAWYCERGNPDRYCSSQRSIDPYVNHTITSRSLVDQLADHGLTWKSITDMGGPGQCGRRHHMGRGNQLAARSRPPRLLRIRQG
jgi:hypothetical protein